MTTRRNGVTSCRAEHSEVDSKVDSKENSKVDSKEQLEDSEDLEDPVDPEENLYMGCSLIRELHVYGSAVPLQSLRDPRQFQHQGYGTLLMEEAERIAREEHGSYKIVVIAGVGTRGYYRRLGYWLEGPYMVKLL